MNHTKNTFENVCKADKLEPTHLQRMPKDHSPKLDHSRTSKPVGSDGLLDYSNTSVRSISLRCIFIQVPEDDSLQSARLATSENRRTVIKLCVGHKIGHPIIWDHEHNVVGGACQTSSRFPARWESLAYSLRPRGLRWNGHGMFSKTVELFVRDLQ